MSYIDIIRQNVFFKDATEDMLDSLSGTLRRPYILDYLNYMIENKKPFYMAIVDIDNLKNINDKFGHRFGDYCIKNVAEALMSYLGVKGLIGRYGGDEFIFVYENDYSTTPKEFLYKLYGGKTIFRRYIEQLNAKFFVTGTTGITKYPEDSETFEGLFEKTDKALYRGKQKGRNCYIIYDDAKHKDINSDILKKVSMDTLMDEFTDMLIKNKPFTAKILDVLRYAKKALQIGGAVYVDKNLNYIFDDMSESVSPDALTKDDIEKFFANESMIEYKRNTRMADDSPILYNFFIKKNILTILIKKIVVDGVDYGYLGFYENKVTRVWQEHERTALSFLQKVIGIINYFKY
ncbi:MAG: GGDEF domain-containing protein [Acholeplasmatales bacterium]|nr:GGDEF domain-containing protein [Acholeplasmatales bacterium]